MDNKSHFVSVRVMEINHGWIWNDHHLAMDVQGKKCVFSVFCFYPAEHF
jgi:hypothetical protein